MIRTINFNWKHLGRALVCFALVFCLLVNVSPLKAKASAITYAKVAIDSLIVVGSAIMGLGVLAGSDTNAYKSLASSVVSALGLGSVIDVVTWAVSGGAYKYAIPQTLVSSIRDYLFSSSVVTEELVTTAKLPAGAVIQGKDQAYTLNTGCMAFSWQYGNLSSRTIILLPYDLSMSSAQNLCTPALGAGSIWISGLNWVYFNAINTSSSSEENRLGLVKIESTGSTATVVNDFLTGEYEFTPKKTVVTTETYRLGAVALHDAAISVAYPDWYANSVVVPGSVAGTDEDDDEVALPIAPGKTWGETIGGTQAGTWEGVGTWTDTNTDTEAGTGAGTNTGAISVTIPGINALVNFFTGTAVVESPLTAIRFGALFDLFPFNIPKGIYDTINFWNASASPPVISIPLPNVTRGGVDVDTYDLDFAEIPGMNTLAALIRGGELILFAIGLLLLTRKVTKW